MKWSSVPAQSIVGATAAQNQFASGFYTAQVYSLVWNLWKLFVCPIFLSTGTFLSMRCTRLGESPPVSLLSWSRGGLGNEWRSFRISQVMHIVLLIVLSFIRRIHERASVFPVGGSPLSVFWGGSPQKQGHSMSLFCGVLHLDVISALFWCDS